MNATCNAVTNTVTGRVARRVRGCVQSQSQNQTVVTSVFGSSVVTPQGQVKSLTGEGI